LFSASTEKDLQQTFVKWGIESEESVRRQKQMMFIPLVVTRNDCTRFHFECPDNVDRRNVASRRSSPSVEYVYPALALPPRRSLQIRQRRSVGRDDFVDQVDE
jgi:hypothetical protein